MQKCISNTNSFQGFWRCWHASFSEWLMRYIYLPLGGRKRRVISLWLIFIFVGAWHDLDYNWMSFSIFNAAGITIESLMREYIYNSGQKWLSTSRSSWTIRILEVSVGAMNVALLTLSNFAINQGFERMRDFVWHAYFKDSEGMWKLNF
jgi:protein-cysteine N-palmitoyltransferase HHAT